MFGLGHGEQEESAASLLGKSFPTSGEAQTTLLGRRFVSTSKVVESFAEKFVERVAKPPTSVHRKKETTSVTHSIPKVEL